MTQTAIHRNLPIAIWGMQGDAVNMGESEPLQAGRTGGVIPDSGQAAFVLSEGAAIPVLISVPHGGRDYPPALLARMRLPSDNALRLEDRLVDRIGEAVAGATGAGLLVARAPRAMIDLNRSDCDIDWDMLGLPARGKEVPNGRARSGLGLVPRRLPGTGEIWRGGLTLEEVQARIAGVHAPYHQALGEALEAVRARFGAALLIDLHSMPSLPRIGGQGAAQLVVGDRFGASCHGALVASAFAHFAAAGQMAAHNRPYAGGYVLDSHAAPRRGIYAFQLEIDRAAYLDSALFGLGDGFAPMVAMLSALVRRLGAEVALLGARRLGEGFAEAAE